jgi:hypothetical protein
MRVYREFQGFEPAETDKKIAGNVVTSVLLYYLMHCSALKRVDSYGY